MTPEKQKLIDGRDKAFAKAALYDALKTFTWRTKGTVTLGATSVTGSVEKTLEALVTDLTVSQSSQNSRDGVEYSRGPNATHATLLYVRTPPPDEREMLIDSDGNQFEVNRTTDIMSLGLLWEVEIKGVPT